MMADFSIHPLIMVFSKLKNRRNLIYSPIRKSSHGGRNAKAKC